MGALGGDQIPKLSWRKKWGWRGEAFANLLRALYHTFTSSGWYGTVRIWCTIPWRFRAYRGHVISPVFFSEQLCHKYFSGRRQQKFWQAKGLAGRRWDACFWESVRHRNRSAFGHWLVQSMPKHRERGDCYCWYCNVGTCFGCNSPKNESAFDYHILPPAGSDSITDEAPIIQSEDTT